MITQVTKGFPRSPTTNTRDFLIKRGFTRSLDSSDGDFLGHQENSSATDHENRRFTRSLATRICVLLENLGISRAPEPVTMDFPGQQGFSSVTRVHSRRFAPCKGSCHVGGAIRDNYQGLVSDPTPLPPYYTAELLHWFLRMYTQIPLHPPKSRNDPRNHRNGSTTMGKTK
jgi:hypothetical protein